MRILNKDTKLFKEIIGDKKNIKCAKVFCTNGNQFLLQFVFKYTGIDSRIEAMEYIMAYFEALKNTSDFFIEKYTVDFDLSGKDKEIGEVNVYYDLMEKSFDDKHFKSVRFRAQ